MLWASPNYGCLLVWALSCFPLPWPAQGLIFECSCFTVYRLSLCSHYSGPEMVLKGDHFCLPRVTDCFRHSWGLGTSVRFLDPSWLYRDMLVLVFPLLFLLFSPSYTLVLLLTAWLLLKYCSCCFDFFFFYWVGDRISLYFPGWPQTPGLKWSFLLQLPKEVSLMCRSHCAWWNKQTAF